MAADGRVIASGGTFARATREIICKIFWAPVERERDYGDLICAWTNVMCWRA